MFTGIIKKTARVKSVEKSSEGLTLKVRNPGWRLKKGNSIAVNGVCSTVIASGITLAFQYMPETVARSAAGALRAGETVNLEPSLKVSDRLDGHIVLGHVDTVGTIIAVKKEGNSQTFTVKPREPKKFMKFVAEKGSVALDGVSLTVTKVRPLYFAVKLIPYTLENTTFKNKKVGSFFNVEFDILAKYLKKLSKR